MKKLERNEEAQLSTNQFNTHLKAFQAENKEALPLSLYLAEAKAIDDSEGSGERTRIISVAKYQNNKFIAAPFYKAISTVLNYNSK